MDYKDIYDNYHIDDSFDRSLSPWFNSENKTIERAWVPDTIEGLTKLSSALKILENIFSIVSPPVSA